MNAEKYDDGIVTKEAPSAEECRESYLNLTTRIFDELPERLALSDTQQFEKVLVRRLLLSQKDEHDPLKGILNEALDYVNSKFDPEKDSYCDLCLDYFRHNKDMWCDNEGNADVDIVGEERINDCITKLEKLSVLTQMFAHKILNPTVEMPFMTEEEAKSIGKLMLESGLYIPPKSSISGEEAKSEKIPQWLKKVIFAGGGSVIGLATAHYSGSVAQVIDFIPGLDLNGNESFKNIHTIFSSIVLGFQGYFIANHIDKAQTVGNAVSDLVSKVNALAFDHPQHTEKFKKILQEILSKLEDSDNQEPLVQAAYLTAPLQQEGASVEDVLVPVDKIEKAITSNDSEVILQKIFKYVVAANFTVGLLGTASVLGPGIMSGILLGFNKIFVSVKNPRKTKSIRSSIATMNEAIEAFDSIKSTMESMENLINFAKGGIGRIAANKWMKYIGNRTFKVIDSGERAA